MAPELRWLGLPDDIEIVQNNFMWGLALDFAGRIEWYKKADDEMIQL